jgi:FkbM family methyltransferase
MLTAAVRDLHRAHGGAFVTDIRTGARALWENNPYITPLSEAEPDVQQLDMHYPLIHESGRRPYHFLHGYVQYLEQQLGVHIPVTRFQGDIHLTEAENAMPPALAARGIQSTFWIIVAGGKYDFTTKWWNPQSYQQVVDHFRGVLQFVQCGQAGHWHPRLEGVVDLVGKTSLREFIRLMYHADGVLCPVTLAMHLAAAVPLKPQATRARACVVIAGGREPPHWEAYPQHQFLHTIGGLPCCAHTGCWKSRCQLVGDGDEKDRADLCVEPVQVARDLRIPRCMDMITADDVIRRIEMYLGSIGIRQDSEAGSGSGIRQNSNSPGSRIRQNPVPIVNSDPQPQTAAPHVTGPIKDVLITFAHGLGDAVQLTTVLQHLKHYHPDWNVDVAALLGKHSAFQGLCRNVFVLNRDHPRGPYDNTFSLDWHECPTCLPSCPSTKAERCLREVFHLAPIAELCTYKIQPSDEAAQAATRYLSKICDGKPGADRRFRSVLIHFQGNTSADKKNLPVAVVERLCRTILDSGYVPVILDWDNRSALADGKTIHNPGPDSELWGCTGTGDAQALAALNELSSLTIGVDSGPLHVAGATTTPTLGVWTGHHPLHYFGHADNVIHLVPEEHPRLLRGDPAVGDAYFREHYRFRTYNDLGDGLDAAVREQLKSTDDSLVFTRGFWIRNRHAEQDLVIVEDVSEQDCYRIGEIPMPRLVVVDVGAHIGCFSRKVHERNPLACIIAVECCPENIPALEKNVGGFAQIVQAALTYEGEVALLNAVFPDCGTTGGSAVINREELRKRVVAGELAAQQTASRNQQYWADFRPMPTVTIEELLLRHDLDRIDILKLDCEGSEFSILGGTTSLHRIGTIVGEFHGKARFLGLVNECLPGWTLRVLRDGEIGLFWLSNPGIR